MTGPLNSKRNSWLFSRNLDLLVLFLPVWTVWMIFLSNSTYFENLSIPTWAWLIFILGIDVGHVWSSLFRTYLSKDEFNAHKKLLILTPIIVFIVSLVLVNVSITWFWRIMAYLAVFHFIKQQYGFVALYNFKAKLKSSGWFSDKLIIYVATLYPVIYWHFNSTSNFNWFVENDFFPIHTLFGSSGELDTIFTLLNVAYWGIIAIWVTNQFRKRTENTPISTGKILWVLTTALNWWFGIVYFNSDLIFSISNVVAHGIPYIALVYYYDVNKTALVSSIRPKTLYLVKRLFIILGVILIAAIVEEYFWDMLVYRDHPMIFERIFPYRWDQLEQGWRIALVIAVLALPQQVHYIIDRFIWKMSAKNPHLKSIFTRNHES